MSNESELDQMFEGSELQLLDQYVIQFNNDIRNAEFYFETLEQILSQEHDKEVLAYKEEAQKLTQTQQNTIFEQSILPFWDEIFNYNLKSSFVISLFSILEVYLKNLCQVVGLAKNSEVRVKDFRGNFLDRTDNFLRVYIGRSINSLDWQTMRRIYKIRSIFTHNQGMCLQHESELKQFIEETDGINVNSGWIEIE